MKRKFICALSFFLCCSLAIPLFCFQSFADNVESWVIVEYQGSNDGSSWSSNAQIPLSEGTDFPTSYKYVRISRVRVLNTTNNPSDIFISFKLSGYEAKSSGDNSCTKTNAQVNTWTNDKSNAGYFRSRNGGNTVFNTLNSENLSVGSIYFIGQFNIPESNDTAFTLTPSSYPTFTCQSTGVCHIIVSDINIVFVGNQNNIYQVTADVQALLATFNVTKDMLEDIWTYLCDSTYVAYRYAGWGNALTTYTTNNPYQSLVLAFSSLSRNISYLCVNTNWSYFDSTNTEIQTNWFNAILQNQNQLVAETRKQSELIEEIADAQDILDDAYNSPHMPGFLGIIANFLGLGDLGGFTSNSPSATEAYGWFSQENHDLINGAGIKGESDIVDFYSQNLQEILGGENDD